MSNKWIEVKGGNTKAGSKPQKTVASTHKKVNTESDHRETHFENSQTTTPPPRSPAPQPNVHLDPLDIVSAIGRTTSDLNDVEHSNVTPRPRTPKAYSEDLYTVSLENTARASQPPASPGRELNFHTALNRYKAIIHDLMTMLANPAHSKSIDTFVEMTEETLKDLKKLKMQVRSKPKPPSTPAPAEKETRETHLEEGAEVKPTKSWASVLQKAPITRSPSKKELTLTQRQLDTQLEADRATSAAKAEARRHEASERRNDRAEEAKARNAKVADKVQDVKHKQKAEAEAAREISKERMTSAHQRHEDIQEAIREKAAKHSQKVEEVLFVNEVSAQNKAMRIENRNAEVEQNLEAKKEEQKLSAKERTEAREAVLERNKEISLQKVEKVKEKEQHRIEQAKRLEEQRKNDAESRQAKSGEREKKVQDHKQAAAAEAESKKQRTEDKILKSQLNREEQRAELSAKRKEKEQKMKERLAEPASKTTVAEVIVKESAAEEEQVNTKLAKASASIARHAKLFVDQYQKECVLGIKDLNKSKFRALSTRLVASNGGSMSRQVLTDMTNFLTAVDHEYARYFNLFDPIMNIMIEARKAEDHNTFRLCSDLLHKVLLDSTEGPANARYFVKAGHVVPLIAMIHEEIKTLQKQNRSAALTVCFSLLQCCVQCIVSDASANVKLAPIRDQLMDLLEVAGVDRFCFAIASTCVDVEDMACLQYALLILQLQIFLNAKKKTDSVEWYQTATVSLTTLLQNILNPGGTSAKDDAITHNTMLVILTAFRLLNIIARHKSSVIGTLLREQESARTELYHTVGAFFGYVSRNETAALERIPQEGAHETSLSKSFEDAIQFGITLQNIPRATLPAYSADGTVFTPAPSSARSSVSQTSTVHGAGGGKGITRAAIHELLLFIGIASIGEPKVQEIFSWGKGNGKPLLQVILTALNINYFTKGRHVLFPTVLSIIAREDRNREIAEREMDCKSLFDFLIGEVQCLPQKQQKKIKASEASATTVPTVTQTAAAPAPQTLVESTEPVKKKLFAINWADLTDSDEEEQPSETKPAADSEEGATTSATGTSTAIATENGQQSKKDKMLQLIKNSSNYNSFFRIENRIPRSMWADIGRFLEESLAQQ